MQVCCSYHVSDYHSSLRVAQTATHSNTTEVDTDEPTDDRPPLLHGSHCYNAGQVLIQPSYGAPGSRVQRTMTAHGDREPRNLAGTMAIPL